MERAVPTADGQEVIAFAGAVRVAMTGLRAMWATETGVVAVSGGADSVALLRALASGSTRLVVAHLNHQLRGDESDRDELFVRDLAERLELPFRSERIAVAELGGNVESIARTVRYEWLARVAAEVEAGWIATGHTADDQAETVLHRLVRGTGVTGLRGIAPQRAATARERMPASRDRAGAVLKGEEIRSRTAAARPDDSLVRPLLAITRADLLAFLTSLNQPFRTDSTNADLALTRNRIRAELLPLLRTFNPAIVDALGRLAAHAGELADWIADDTRKLLHDAERPRAGDTLILDAATLSAVGELRTRELLRLLWDRERWPANAMTAAHWHRAAAVALGTHPPADFPAGVHVRRAGKVVQLRRRS